MGLESSPSLTIIIPNSLISAVSVNYNLKPKLGRKNMSTEGEDWQARNNMGETEAKTENDECVSFYYLCSVMFLVILFLSHKALARKRALSVSTSLNAETKSKLEPLLRPEFMSPDESIVESNDEFSDDGAAENVASYPGVQKRTPGIHCSHSCTIKPQERIIQRHYDKRDYVNEDCDVKRR